MIQLTVNGVSREVDADEDMPLLWVLRDLLGLTGTKYGCGEALCGACTVHLDGHAVRSCVTPIRRAAGHAVTTIEGLSPTGEHPLQRAWVELGVPQCGFCQAARSLTPRAARREPPADRRRHRPLARGNLCRCGTYLRIRAAVRKAAGP
jgi:isoquinoline 1-oxidoreductase alpha subunit